jgi:C4-dicarboxylate-specific signal transduction histidine kinase
MYQLSREDLSVPTQENVDRARGALGQIGRILEGLKRANIQDYSSVPVRLKELVHWAAVQAQESFGKSTIEVSIDISARLSLRGDPDYLADVFLNIVTNAYEAIGETGRDDGRIEIRAGRDDGVVWLCFQDNGSGITREALNELGRPFYTSKQSKTGLSLCGRGYAGGAAHSNTVSVVRKLGPASKN